MEQNNIQCVVNSGAYIQDKALHVGGSNKDFYAGHYDDYVHHVSFLTSNIDAVQEVSKTNRYSRVAYAKVKMREDAIAKSYRPTKSLFTKGNRSSVVGGMGIGEMLVEFRPESFDKINNALSRSQNEQGHSVSRVKSEVGGIQEIVPYNQSDRVPFDVSTVKKAIEGNRGVHFYVELFHSTEAIRRLPFDNDMRKLIASFFDVLESKKGVYYRSLPVSGSGGLMYLSLSEPVSKTEIDDVLGFLSEHPLVRRVHLAPAFSALNSEVFAGEDIDLTGVEDISTLPKIGVIDGGISSNFKDWILYSCGSIPEKYRDELHASKIAGLLIKGQFLNGAILCPEEDGCAMADICLMPANENNVKDVYPHEELDFLDDLRSSVEEVKEVLGIRVFNLSINNQLINGVAREYYSFFARTLDSISEQLDVLFVISAGNLQEGNIRDPWIPSDPDQNISSFVRPEFLATSPAESLRNVSVMALDANNLAPAKYTRVGTVLDSCMKPDFAYVGGDKEKENQLFSINDTGQIVSASGTSFAAPLVAKIIASLDSKLQGPTAIETLIALAVHSAYYPSVIGGEEYNEVRHKLYGFGIPQSSSAILSEGDSSMTLVFNNRIPSNKILSFPFPWPSCLKDRNGKCRGDIKVTLVSRPAIDASYGQELVRENISVYLRYKDRDGKKHGFLEREKFEDENTLIHEALKWSPIKVYSKHITRRELVGSVYFEVEYQSRDGLDDNYLGVPFTVIVTISDPKEEAMVNREMKADLTAIGVNLTDVQIANVVRQQLSQG